MGYEIYSVVSGSMDPEIPIGSVVYVAPAEARYLEAGDIIAFVDDGAVVTHRVVSNHLVEGELVTKGDANPIEDIDPVPYEAVVGKVEKHFPLAGHFMSILASNMGKVYLLLIAACGVMFNLLAGRMRERRQETLQKRSAEIPVREPETAETPSEKRGRHASKRRLGWVRPVIMTVLAVIFLGSGGVVLYVMHQYNENDRLYASASERFTQTATAADASSSSGGNKTSGRSGTSAEDRDIAPIEVDFDALLAVNEDVVGWIYCEGTGIDYPVLRGENDDVYLHRNYEGAYSVAGSIFMESDNAADFSDANTIVYGHHMKNGSMFGGLEEWASQEYYEEHPEMWLLTPEQDYRIELVSGHHTSAYSNMYTVYRDGGEELQAYLEEAVSQSDFTTDVPLNPEGRYVMLSTCAYIFDNARYVLHGELVPVDSAGGIPLESR